MKRYTLDDFDTIVASEEGYLYFIDQAIPGTNATVEDAVEIVSKILKAREIMDRQWVEKWIDRLLDKALTTKAGKRLEVTE